MSGPLEQWQAICRHYWIPDRVAVDCPGCFLRGTGSIPTVFGHRRTVELVPFSRPLRSSRRNRLAGGVGPLNHRERRCLPPGPLRCHNQYAKGLRFSDRGTRGGSHGTAAGNFGAATRGLVIEQYPQRHGGWRGENSRSVGKPNPKPRVRSGNHAARGSRLSPRCRRFIDRNTWATRRTGQDGLYGFRSGLLRSVRRIGVPGKSNASRSPLTRYRR